MRLVHLALSLVSLTLLSACSNSDKVEPADLVFSGGHIFTADPLRPQASAVAVRGDRIVYVGSSEGAWGIVDERTCQRPRREGTGIHGLISARTHSSMGNMN